MKRQFKFISLLLLLMPTFMVSCKKDYSAHILACMGDSITWGSTPKTGVQLDTPYPVALKNDLGFGHVCNYGVGSSTLCDGKGSYAPMVERLTKVSTSVSIIIIWGGVNDFKNECTLGDINSTDSGTIYGALNTIATTLNTTYKDSFSMFMTPLPAKWQREVIQLTDVQQAIIKVGNKHNIPVLDLYTNSEFESEWDKSYSDGVHPSQNYVDNMLVPKISRFIREKVKP